MTAVMIAGPVPPFSAEIRTRIHVDNARLIIYDVPMIIALRGKVLVVQGIDIDETRIPDRTVRDVLSIIDGQTIYGTIPR